MNSIDEFVALVSRELALELSVADTGRSLDELPGWDSVYLLWLVVALERATGRRVSMPDALQAASLGDLYQLSVPAGERSRSRGLAEASTPPTPPGTDQ